MKKFTLEEIKNISIILVLLFGVIAINMSVSLRRGRDSIRKDDISAIEKALDTYYQKYRIYPISSKDGQIVGCFDGDPIRDKKTGFPINAVACKWGESKFESVNLMPRDPNYKSGSSYLYMFDGKKYQFYISLEGKDEAEYTPSIVAKNLQCGNKICNYGRGL